MDEKKPTTGNVPPPEAQSDAEQFTTWMTEYGRPALIGLAVAVVVLLGLSIWRNQKQEKADAAVQALFQGRAPEEFRQMAVADPKAPTAPVALATAAAEFYAQGRYDEALSTYQSFLAQYPGHMLEPDAQLGVAASLEALDDFEAAAESYEAFAASHATSTLAPQAVMGAARSREQLGQFDDARALYEDFIAANPESSWLPQAESGLLFLKKAERAKDLPLRRWCRRSRPRRRHRQWFLTLIWKPRSPRKKGRMCRRILPRLRMKWRKSFLSRCSRNQR